VAENPELLSMLVFLAVFLLTAGIGGLVLFHLYGDHRRAVTRLRDLSAAQPTPAAPRGMGKLALFALPKIGNLILPSNEEQLAFLKTRLTRAGIYGPNAVKIFLGMKMMLMLVLPLAASVIPFAMGLLSWLQALALGVTAMGVGLLTPSFWLDYQRGRRQEELRRALPDILDMLVLCVEAGVSLIAAFQRVTEEVQVVHPGLAREMNIIQREIQLGLSIGDALLKFGDRCDIDEVRNLAQIILQSERYGTSSVKALRIHSDTSRQQRQQSAEEKAQKAAVKILFPTLLCIFPAIFIVILGPAAYQMAALFSQMK
jgi:tight adherence protein C